MAWKLAGQVLESCSCNMVCPCVFGPAKPDQGWCSGALVFDIQQGDSDGISLNGTKVVFAVDLPGDFLSGNGNGRLYIDEGASPDQRRELQAIFTGKKGGAFEMLNSLMAKWLPTEIVKTEIARDNSSVKVGSVGELKLQLLKTEDGQQTTLQHAPVIAGFGISSSNLARGDGSQWSDPQMRRWTSGGTGGISAFTLRA
jgi:hypothetical protein